MWILQSLNNHVTVYRKLSNFSFWLDILRYRGWSFIYSKIKTILMFFFLLLHTDFYWNDWVQHVTSYFYWNDWVQHVTSYFYLYFIFSAVGYWRWLFLFVVFSWTWGLHPWCLYMLYFEHAHHIHLYILWPGVNVFVQFFPSLLVSLNIVG